MTSFIQEKENGHGNNNKKKRRIDESAPNEASCFTSTNATNERGFSFDQGFDETHANYASKLQSKMSVLQNNPSKVIKSKLLNGDIIDLKMYLDDVNCFEVRRI